MTFKEANIQQLAKLIKAPEEETYLAYATLADTLIKMPTNIDTCDIIDLADNLPVGNRVKLWFAQALISACMELYQNKRSAANFAVTVTGPANA